MLASLVFAIAVAASPVHKPISAKIHKVPSTHVEKLNSAQFALNRFSSSSGNSEDLTNVNNLFYKADIVVGTNQKLTIDLDTGSSDLWVRGSQCTDNGDGSCQGSSVDTTDSNLVDQGQTYSVKYGSGGVSGEIFTADVSVAGAKVQNLPIGVGTNLQGFANQADGLLGLGFDSISQISQALGKSANFFDGLGFTGANSVFSFYLSDAKDGDNGEVTFGGIDSSKFTGNINYVPLNSQTFWQFDATNLSFNVAGQTGTVGDSNYSTDAISDTGTSLIILGQTAADGINQAIGATYDSNQGAYAIDCGVAKTGSPIDFVFGDQQFTLSIPPQYYVLDAGNGQCISGILAGAGNGTPNIFGDILSRAYYTVYDKGNTQVGFALAKHA
ncbi:Vacuolar protease A [Boothiomyces sp. JEL0838]|nr:Vacuolar protease A [Boothiomyces sp. JEL0838]